MYIRFIYMGFEELVVSIEIWIRLP